MWDIEDRVIPSDTFEEADAFLPIQNSVYLYGQSPEDRSNHLSAWRSRARDVVFINVASMDAASFTVEGEASPIALRSESQLMSLWQRTPDATRLYLDITGLPHHVWAPLLKAALATRKEVAAIYVEPSGYTKSAAPVEGEIYDLSLRISGIAPIPGFSYLAEKEGQTKTFVPLLGFEGTRLSYVIEQVQPSNDRIVPIIGCPGFKPEFFFESYVGNKRPLRETEGWRTARYVPANCPFSCFYTLSKIALDYPMATLMIAPIGTKPHALGAVLFHLNSGHPTELVYDHPTRKPGRTSGRDKLLVYYVSALIPHVSTRAAAKRLSGREDRDLN